MGRQTGRGRPGYIDGAASQWSGPPCPRVLVLTRESGASIFVDHVCPLGRRLGIRPGGTLGQARAVAPNLEALPADELRDRALLHRLASWALRFSPLVEPLEPGTLLIDITGCGRLFGGEPNLARQAVEGIRRQGFHVQAAIADTVGAAYALAVYGGSGIGDRGSGLESDERSEPGAMPKRSAGMACGKGDFVNARHAGAALRHGTHTAISGSDQSKIQNPKSKIDLIVPPGHTVSWLAPLPPAALRIEPRTAERLEMLGVRTIGDLLTLPRSTLPSRFGRELVLRLQQALGEVHEAVAARRPDAPPTVHVALEEPLSDGALLQQLASDLLGRLLAEVERREAGLRRLECIVERHEGTKAKRHEREYRRRTGALEGSGIGDRGSGLESDGRSERETQASAAPNGSRSARIVGARQSKIQNPKSKIDRAEDSFATSNNPIPDPRSPLPLLSIGLARASRSRRHVGELLARRLEQIDCTPGVVGLRLTAREITPWTPGQSDLFDDRPPGDAEALGCLIDRIANRIGYSSILRPRLIDDHQPEMAYRYVSVGEAGLEEERHEERHEGTKARRHEGEHRRPAGADIRGSGIGDRGSGLESDDQSEREAPGASQSKIQNPKSKIDPAGDGFATTNAHSPSSPLPHGRGSAGKGFTTTNDHPLPYGRGSAGDVVRHSPFAIRHSAITLRPLRLLPHPAPLRVMALVPEGPPGWMHYAGVEHRLLHAAGPERIETAWWRGGDVRRDYYRVTSATGEQFWIFRDLDTGQWRVHGIFT